MGWLICFSCCFPGCPIASRVIHLDWKSRPSILFQMHVRAISLCHQILNAVSHRSSHTKQKEHVQPSGCSVFICIYPSQNFGNFRGQKRPEKTIEHQLNHIKSYFTLFHIINWWEKQWFPEFSVNFPLNQSIDIHENRCQKRHPSRPREVCWSSTASERWPLPRMASRLPRLERRRAAFFGLVTWCLMMFNDAQLMILGDSSC